MTAYGTLSLGGSIKENNPTKAYLLNGKFILSILNGKPLGNSSLGR